MEILNAANLIKLEDITNKEKLKELELAPIKDNDPKIIFNIYQIPFNLNSLINAKDIHQTLDESDASINVSKIFIVRRC